MAGSVSKVANCAAVVARSLRYVGLFPGNLVRINRMISKPSYYPELQRKSKAEMWVDNLVWLFKNKEFNKFYISYGMDAKGFRNCDEFLPNEKFIRLRNKGNHFPADYGQYSYIAILRDKYLFSTYLSGAIGEKSVVNVKALIVHNKAFLVSENRWTDIRELLAQDCELVYKIIDGECAHGVMLVTVEGDKVIADDCEYTKDAFVESLKNQRLIVQDVVKQHEKMNVFGTRSVNTIRAVTIQGKSGAVNVFNAFLRVSASVDAFVDNRAVGGLGVGIDLETGKLMKYGFPHDSFGVRTEMHNLSGIKFEGFEMPYWKETVELITNAHKQLYDIQSIGWDVIITADGPVLLEGNDNWEIGGPQDTMGGLKKRFMEMCNC